MPRARRIDILAPLLVAFLAALAGLVPVPASATSVSALAAQHRNGQTFLTWAPPSGSGWTYRVYARTSPIATSGDLAGATLLGTSDDSSWCDRRLSSLRATVFGYAIDSLAAPLTAARRLFVATPVSSGARWYAVTAQASGGAEDRTIVTGSNATAAPIGEVLAPPRPVYQRMVTGDYGETCEVYTLWVTDQGTALYPAMTDRAGMAYDIGIVRGGTPPDNVLWVRGHGRGGNFLATLSGGDDPVHEWRVSNDDYLPNDDVDTFYYGYHDGYDPFATGNPLPTSGVVRDYTWQRVLYTLDWVLATFPVDSDRVYARGGSMGGSFTLDFAMHDPERIAAAMALVPKVDLSDFVDSVLPPLWFAPLWGDPATTDLPTPEGIGIYERLRMASLAAAHPERSRVPMITLSGRQDVTVGWHEKIPFYAAMETNRHGGMFYWDQRTHISVGEWEPMYVLSYLRRYRRSQSFPALSHCSLDDDPGNGDATNGDLVGQMNAYVEWDTSIADYPDRWDVKLTLRDLTLLSGTRPAPDSATVDVTPRRLQRFVVTPSAPYAWSVRRFADGVEVASGVVTADALGLVTVPAVKVYRTGTLLRVKVPGPADVPEAGVVSGPIALSPDRQPVRDGTILTVRWPGAGEGRIELYDVSGRRVTTPFRGNAAGTMRVPLDTRRLEPGLYLARARLGTASVTTRILIVR
ncbi:MAG: prolyl oligopeptidase family serine peptidase [Candidatus Eisenbacteria bacterium]